MKVCFIQLVSSPDIWSSLITALIGGGVAYYIARFQVKKSEEGLTQQRAEDNARHVIELEEAQKRVLLQINGTKKHEREMELVRIQLGYCNDCMEALESISDPIVPLVEKVFDYHNAMSSSIDGRITDEMNELKKEMLAITNPMRNKAMKIRMAAKINELSEDSYVCVESLLTSISEIIFHTYSANKSDKVLILAHTVPDQVEKVHPIFQTIEENLINSLIE